MNILHIIPYFSPAWRLGGSVESVFRLCRGVAGGECCVKVLTTDSNGFGQLLNVDIKNDVKLADFFLVRYCHRIFQESVSPSFLRWLPSYVRWADVIHLTAVYSFPTLPALFLCKLSNKPVVWSPRGSLQRWQGSSKTLLKGYWEKLCYLVAPNRLVLHVTSEDEAQASLYRFPGIKTVVIPNGVEVPKQVTNVPRNGLLRLGYLGRIDPKKGIENLLIACEMLLFDKAFPLLLTIGGTGNLSYTKTIYKFIEKLHLPPHVKIVGHIDGDKKRDFFENIDILLLPSHTENFGLVVAEALAHSVPVIASKGTPWKRVEEVGCGLWVDNNPGSLAKAIIHMSQMPLLEMGKKGQEWMKQEFSWAHVAKKMKLLYEELAMKPF